MYVLPVKTRQSQTAFTLVEVLVTIAIVSALIGIGAMNTRSMIENNQVERVNVDLRMDIVFTRGEAIKRGGWVSLCGSETGSTCTDSYNNGWMVYHDVNKDGTFTKMDTILSWTKQKYRSVKVDVQNLGQPPKGPLTFNYRGYPDRSIKLTADKGLAEATLVLETTGHIESQ